MSVSDDKNSKFARNSNGEVQKMIEVNKDKIPDALQRILDKGQIQTEDILTTTILDFKKLGLIPEQINMVKKITAKNSFMGFRKGNVFEKMHNARWKSITFGCDALDSITDGGIPCNGITELFGESSAGKTQICYQLALTVQLAPKFGGLNKGAVLICTENRLSSKRLNQMCHYLKSKYTDESIRQKNFFDNIFVEFVPDSENLIQCCQKKLPTLLANREIGIIIIDSVAGIFRTETDFVNRAKTMRNFIQLLNKLSIKHSCGILCVNQATTPIDSQQENGVVPCLGLAWANLVTTRLQISRGNVLRNLSPHDNEAEHVIRTFKVIFSSCLPPAQAEYLITEKGVISIPDR